jgi:hypothetical protein
MMMMLSFRESFVNLRQQGMFPAKFKISWLLGDHYNWVVAPLEWVKSKTWVKYILCQSSVLEIKIW